MASRLRIGLALVVLAATGASSPAASPPSCGDKPFVDAATAFTALEGRLASPLRVWSAALYPGYADFEAQDPKQPMHIDRHHFEDGRWSDPEPVQAGRNRRQIEAKLFTMRAEDIGRVPSLLEAAVAAVATEAGCVSHVLIERSEEGRSEGTSTTWTRPQIRVYVEGPRGGGFVEFRLDGTRGRVVKW
jgi:hypothetical protein